MVIKITLIVSSDFPDAALVPLVGSIDDQSLPYADFDVLFLSDGARPERRDRLARLAANRPNVFLQHEAKTDVDELIRGELVLALTADRHGPDVALAPQALERLWAMAEDSGAAAVVGRIVGDAPGDLVRSNTPAANPEQARAALAGGWVAVRRSVLVGQSQILTSDQAITVPVDAQPVAVVADYPSLLPARATGNTAPADSTISVEPAELTWSNGSLTVEVRAAVSGADLTETGISIRHSGTRLDFWLPRRVRQEDSTDDSTLVLRTEIDVLTAAAGSTLGEGVWQLMLHVAGHSLPVPAPKTAGSPLEAAAIVGPVLVVPVATKTGLGLDIGATSASVVGQAYAGDATIVEADNGTLLTLQLPKVHVSGVTAVEGKVVLDRFRLPARLVSDGHRATVECFVSGIAGSRVLATQFGGAAVKTGLELHILGNGLMTVERTAPTPKTAAKPAAPAKKAAAQQPAAQKAATPKAAATKATATKATPKKATAKKAPRKGTLARIRRKIPQSLEPAVKVVAKNEIARGIYRQFTRR